MRRILAFLGAVGFGAVLATVAQTQFVLAGLQAVGAPIGTPERLSMTLDDLKGFGPLYALFIGLAFLIAFLAAGWTARRTGLTRPLVFGVAGGAAIWVMLFLMREAFFGVPLVAGARTAAGLWTQVLCGAAAGALFALLTPRRASREF